MTVAPEVDMAQVMPATWDDARVLNAQIGEYITVARRSGDTWFVGSVNDEKGTTLEIKLDFLARMAVGGGHAMILRPIK